MNKKLRLLVVGVLAALALTALPGAASAKETVLKCEGAFCEFTIAGGLSTFSTVGADTVSCTSFTGSGEAINLNAEKETTTLKVGFKFHGCKETDSGFKFACTTPGQPSGTIVSNTMTGHLIALPTAFVPSENGVLFTDWKMTFTCAGGFSRTTVTGNLIGENGAKCGAAANSLQTWRFIVPLHGTQIYTTWTGNTFSLSAATNHNTTPTATSGYETAAQAGTGTLAWNQSVQVTCAS